MSSLYSRYVPPKKSKNIIEATKSPEPQPSITSASPPSKLYASTPYARWVPPKHNARSIAQIQSPVSVPTTQPSEEEEAKSTKRRRIDEDGEERPREEKREKKRKKKKSNGNKIEQSVERQAEDWPTEAEDDVKAEMTQLEIVDAPESDVDTTNNPEGDQGQSDSDSDPVAQDAKTQAILAKYQHSIQLQTKIKVKNAKEGIKTPSPEPELHGLEPLPQPVQAPQEAYVPTFDSLPSWIGEPHVIASKDTVRFEELGLSKKINENLSRKGYIQALPVQTAVLPMMSKGPGKYYGDICVSAPTGSGKTMAYLLPLIEALQNRLVRRLSALIIVPTRELVMQAREMAKICAAGTRVSFGTAVGNVALATEQSNLIRKGQRYDPRAAKSMHDKAAERISLGYDEEDSLLEDVIDMLPDHVPEYTSEVDILICTPGRLVDHIRSTPGFSLDHVEWLVIDEVDQLLEQDFQGFINVLHPALFPPKTYNQMTALEKVRMSVKGQFEHRFVQKVILSATMTRNLTHLSSLKLQRPMLIALQSEQSDELGIAQATGGFELPATLEETAVPVADGSDKPLYLIQLLKDEFDHFGTDSDAEASESSSDSDSSSDSSSDSDSDSSSDSDSDSVPAGNGSTGDLRNSLADMPPHPLNSKSRDCVLVFTSNNDNASRLKYLLSTLFPKNKSLIGTLTKSSATSTGQKILNAFRSGKVKVLIASDRASRGLDVPDLASVINYDMPSSVTSYVHRVGRTARAGKGGKAWTLFTNSEARWFWKSIAQGVEIRRGGRIVERRRIDPKKLESMRSSYQRALVALQSAVHGIS